MGTSQLLPLHHPQPAFALHRFLETSGCSKKLWSAFSHLQTSLHNSQGEAPVPSNTADPNKADSVTGSGGNMPPLEDNDTSK